MASSLSVDTVWTAVYGGSDDDGASAVAIDNQGNYIVAGHTYSFGSGYADLWILKIDPQTGDTIWSVLYGGVHSEGAEGIVVAPDGHYIVAGYTYSYGNGGSDIWLLKVDSSDGSLIWSRTYGGSEDDGAYAIALDDAGHLVVVGYTTIDPYRDGWVLKVDSDSGGIIWSRYYGGATNDELYGIAIDGDGNYVAVGRTDSPTGGYFDMWILKLDPDDGSSIWEKIYGNSMDDGAADVIVDTNGDYVVAGRGVFDINYYNDTWILKLDPATGDTLWSKRYSTPDPEGATAIALLPNGDYAVGGMTAVNGSWDAWIMRLNQQGDSLWSAIYGGDGSDGISGLQVDQEGYMVMAGYTYSYGNGFSDVWVLKLAEVVPVGESPTLGVKVMGGRGEIAVRNLADTRVVMEIYSIDGRKVRIVDIAPNAYLRIHQPAGVYGVRFTCCGKTEKRIITVLP